MLPPRASQAADFERNGVTIIWETVHLMKKRADLHWRFGQVLVRSNQSVKSRQCLAESLRAPGRKRDEMDRSLGLDIRSRLIVPKLVPREVINLGLTGVLRR